MSKDILSIERFRPGKIFNKIKIEKSSIKPLFEEVDVTTPSRINAMCFDTGKLASPDKPHVYTAGELAFSVGMYTHANIKVRGDTSKIKVQSKRPSIVIHTALLMKNFLSIKEGLYIEADNLYPYNHCGFGSSSALQSSVAIAINAAYGNPMTNSEIIRCLSQNYGEEIDNSTDLVHIQANGAGPAVALYGGMIALAGEGSVIIHNQIPPDYSFVFGLPKSFRHMDAISLLKKEIEVLPKFNKTSKYHGKDVAYLVLHKLLPAIERQDMKSIGKIVETYKFDYGDIFSTGNLWDGMINTITKIRKHKKTLKIDLISSSSVGPVIYALTKNTEAVRKYFEKNHLETFVVKPDNRGAVVHVK